MRGPPNPELVRRALERRRAGESFGSIAKDAGVTESTIRRWWSLAGEAPPPPPILRGPAPAPVDTPEALAAELEPVAVALDAAGGAELARVVRRAADALRAGPAVAALDDMPDPGADTRGWIVAMIARAERSYRSAEALNNAGAAKQYAAILEKWAGRLRQHDAQHDGDDVVTIPRAEVAAARQRLRETIEALTAGPVLCSRCSSEIRAGWGDEPDAATAAAP